MKVLGMGNALVDILAFIDNDDLLEKFGLPKGGMLLIDATTKEAMQESLSNKEIFQAAGGSASNTIGALAKLGIQTGFIGEVGNDSYGNYYREDLENAGVKPHLIISDNNASGIATTLISENGQRTFGTYLGAAANMTHTDLKATTFEGYDFFYIEGYLVQNLDLIRTAINMAKKQGAKVVLDMASYNVVEASRDFLLEIIPSSVDIIFANEEEAQSLFNTKPEEALDKLAKMVDIAIVKVGEKGSYIKQGKTTIHVPALKVDCIDTTGAGDLYAAGFLYGLINSCDLEKCGKKGTLLAGNVIQVVGPKMNNDTWTKLIQEIK